MVLDTKRATEKTILIVEDDAATGELLCLFLSEETPHRAILVPDGFQALNVIKDITPDLFLLDYRLPRMNGNALEQETEDPNVTVCIKPFDLDELLTMVEKLLA